jgi:hypothetical protein
MATEAQRLANQKQDAARAGKRVQLWLEQDDAKALARIQRAQRLPSRIATVRWLIEQNSK